MRVRRVLVAGLKLDERAEAAVQPAGERLLAAPVQQCAGDLVAYLGVRADAAGPYPVACGQVPAEGARHRPDDPES